MATTNRLFGRLKSGCLLRDSERGFSFWASSPSVQIVHRRPSTQEVSELRSQATVVLQLLAQVWEEYHLYLLPQPRHPLHESRFPLSNGVTFNPTSLVLCVRWYLRYPLIYRNLEEMMLERGLTVDHTTV